jgi:acyl-CoA synthetase (NDP forming)
LTTSGGIGAMIVDMCYNLKMTVPTLLESTKEKLRKIIPPFLQASNPLDVATMAIGDPEGMQALIETVHAGGKHDVFIVALTAVSDINSLNNFINAIAAGQKKTGCLVLPIFLACPDHAVLYARQLGMSAATDLRRTVYALSSLVWWSAKNNPAYEQNGAGQWEQPQPALPEHSTSGAGTQPRTEVEAKAILRDFGLPIVPGKLAASVDEAVAVANELGYPIVAKIVSSDIPHKTEAGGVKINLGDEQQVRLAFQQIIESARAYSAAARIEGVLIEKMVKGGIETVIGIRRDPVLGFVLLFGLGGIFVEVMKDVAIRVLPVDDQELALMVTEPRGYALLQGARGKPAADIECLIETMKKLSKFVETQGANLEELDLNPVMVLPQGQGVYIVDALLVERKAAE